MTNRKQATEERIVASFHKKAKRKKQPTRRHKDDKIKACKVELEFWQKRIRPTNSKFLKDLVDQRVKQLKNKIKELEK